MKMWQEFQYSQLELYAAFDICLTHSYKVDLAYDFPVFHPSFENAVWALVDLFHRQASEEEQRNEYIKFTKTFGTHYIKEAYYGSCLIIEKLVHGHSQGQHQLENRQRCFMKSTEHCIVNSTQP